MVTVKLMDDNRRYNVFITQKAHDKTRAYVELCDKEIGWFGYVKKLENGFLIEDVYLLKQKVHSATTEIDPQATADYYNNLSEEEKDYYFKNHRLWGHSHVNMSPTPSGQDDTQGKELSKDVEDYYIRLITNKKNEYNITIYDNVNGVIVTTDTIGVYNPENIALRKEIEEEIKEKVSSLITTPVTYKSYQYNYSDDYYKSYLAPKTNSLLSTTSVTRKKTISKIELGDILKKEDYKCKALFI